MLANNVASVCTGINTLIRTKLSCVSHVFLLPLVQSPSAFPASANVVPSLYEFLGGLLVARSAQVNRLLSIAFTANGKRDLREIQLEKFSKREMSG